jgi:hypothetical protein
MKDLGGIKLLVVAALALIILAGTGTAVSLSNSGGGTWKYQRDISIKENSGTTLTDYQVLIELKGTDFPSEAKSDGADVRFADSGGNELNYWIESWDFSGKNAKVWVNVPKIPSNGNMDIVMYYGNTGASSSSNSDRMPRIRNHNFEYGDTSSWMLLSGTFAISSGNSGCESDCINMGIGQEGKYYAHNGGDSGIGSARSSNFLLMKGVDKIKFLRAGGSEYPSGIYVKRSSDDTILCSAINGADTDTFFVDHCGGLSTYAGNVVYIFTQDTISGGWSKLFFDDFHQVDANDKILDYVTFEPTVTLSPPKSSSLSITKSATPYSLRQFQESTIKVLIENSGTSDVKDIEVMDSIHPSFDLTGGDFPDPKKFDSIRAGEARELQYTIRSKESGAFTLEPATATYADSEGNIQEVKSEPVSIKVVPSSDGGSSGTNTGQNSKSASVNLHGEKTDVVMGEDILLRLSAVNLITKPKMHVQVIIIPPSGMSVTSSEFSKSAAGQFTANYQLEPGDGKDIEVRIRSNQVGDFNVNGRIIYYFGEEKEKAEDQTLNLPIKVRKEPVTAQTHAANPEQKQTPGFELAAGSGGLLLLAVILKKRNK